MKYRKNYIITAAALILAVISLNFITDSRPTIFLIGDSTMADKPVDDNPEHGWGQVFPEFFNDQVIIENHARNGRSTKSFISDGLWQKVYDKIRPGDYVFIQFGHNDSKISDTNRYAEAHTLYKKNLIKFITEARLKSAYPVLLTPVNRRKFDSDGKFIDQHGDYPGVVREVANELKVPVIDVHAKSLKLFSELGAEATKKLFLHIPPKTYKALSEGKEDNTHFTREGAEQVAKMVVEGIKEINLPIASMLKSDPGFTGTGKNKVVALDYFFNHELMQDAEGKPVQFHYIWEDKENSGFSILGSVIENTGADLYEIKSAPSNEELNNVSIYIIVDPDTPRETAAPNYIKDSSIASIENWVKEGGVLVLMGNDSVNAEFKHLNNLAEKFGIHFNEDCRNRVTGTNFQMGKFDKFPEHPIFRNVKSIYLKEISTFTLKAPAQPVFTDKGDVIMACANYGKGFVFAVGDPWVYNEYIDNRRLPAEFENYKAAVNLFSWLLEKATVKKNVSLNRNLVTEPEK